VTVDAAFCPRCSAALPGPPPVSCAGCGYALFVNARPTGTVVIVVDDRYLSVLRARSPRAGRWELPGGFADGWEHPADAAVREAREELSVDIALREFVGMFIGEYEFQGERLPVLDCFWTADVVGGEIVLDPAESSDYAWLPIRDEPDLAFETMNQAIRALQTSLAARVIGK